MAGRARCPHRAGGQQGTTFPIRLGGQALEDIHAVRVTGSGVTARIVDYYRRLNNQEMQLLNEQLKALKRATTAIASATAPRMPPVTLPLIVNGRMDRPQDWDVFQFAGTSNATVVAEVLKVAECEAAP